MTIHRLFVNSPLGPEEISIVVAAYEQALSTLGLVDRDDPLTQLIAKENHSDLADRHQGLGDNMRTGDQSAWHPLACHRTSKKPSSRMRKEGKTDRY
jgi:hypothetical protein